MLLDRQNRIVFWFLQEDSAQGNYHFWRVLKIGAQHHHQIAVLCLAKGIHYGGFRPIVSAIGQGNDGGIPAAQLFQYRKAAVGTSVICNHKTKVQFNPLGKLPLQLRMSLSAATMQLHQVLGFVIGGAYEG